MKKYLLYICTIALLGSCKKANDTPIDPTDDSLCFTAQVNAKEDDWSDMSKGTTRGEVTTNLNIDNFGVFCYYTGTTTWDDTPVEERIPNKMFNVHVTKNSDTDVWEYTPPQTWEGKAGHNFTFFGYSPHTLSAKAVGIKLLTDATTQDSPKIKFTTSNDATNQTDLLIAKPQKDLTPVRYVRMNLGHALSRVGFSVKLNRELDPGTEMRINSVKLIIKGGFGSFYKTATIDLLTQKWDDFENLYQEESYTLPTPDIKPILTTTPSLVIANNAYLFFIPQTLAANVCSVEFVAETKVGTTPATTKTYSNIKIPAVELKASKSYNYVFAMNPDQSLKLEEVKVTAWEVKDGGEYDI